MNALKTLIPAAALAAGLAVAASANATIYIGVSLNGGAISVVATDPTNTNVAVSGMTFGTFTINNISATGDVVLPDLLSSNSLNTATSGSGTLDVYVLETNLPASTDHGSFVSSLTSNKLTGGLTVTESTYFNSANTTTFAAGTLLASQLFTAIGTSVIDSGSAAAGPYALTEQYHIVAGGAGTANSTIDVSSVPEPATWGLMILGFGGIGAMVRNRRRQGVALTA